MSQPYLVTTNLTKDFGAGRGALDIDITIHPGEIVGFIGPNGAGKTTAMRMIMGLLEPDTGSVEIFGKPVDTSEQMQQVSRRIGFMPGEVSFYPQFNAEQLCIYASELYGHDYLQAARLVGAELDLDMKRPFKYLSLGNKKKLGVVQALMHDPDLIILDEPTSGLDPLVQQKVLGLLKAARAAGKGVFLSSHTLSEVQQVCDRIIMIKDSRIIIQDDTRSILSRALKVFRVDHLDHILAATIEKLDGVKSVEKQGSESVIRTTNTKPVIEALTGHGRYDFYLERSSLEDMFLAEYK